MRKENDYTVYDNDTLTPGYKAKIEHTVYSGSESDLSDLLKLTVGDISALAGYGSFLLFRYRYDGI